MPGRARRRGDADEAGMVDIDTEFVSPVTMGETFVQSEPIPLDHRRVVAAICCLLGGRRCGCKAQR